MRRSTGRYEVWQSKRYESFSAAKIKNAVDTFVNGAWCATSDTLVLCVRAPLRDTKLQDEIERQSQWLRSLNIELETLDAEGFSARLKDYPEIVDDFFGRTWVQAFCGGNVADNLQDRLEPAEAAELRRALGDLYRGHFEVWDSGGHLPTSSLDGSHRRLPLGDRYVEPELLESTRVTSPQTDEFAAGETPETFSPEDEAPPRITAPLRLRRPVEGNRACRVVPSTAAGAVPSLVPARRYRCDPSRVAPCR